MDLVNIHKMKFQKKKEKEQKIATFEEIQFEKIHT